MLNVLNNKEEIKIVTVGGGTGSSTILKGFKKITSNISAIVTVADDGGGSGVLREDFNMIPPGDIRACLVALANTEPAMEKLMTYRFSEGRLKNQSFGNLFLAAMEGIYGDFNVGLKEASKVLAITGRVFPMTLENIILYAELMDGSIIEGESNITFLTRSSGSRIKRVFIKPAVPKPLSEAIDALLDADLIVIGPGSLYTSIMPNLLVEEIKEAIASSRAKKIMISNIMTQAGETDEYIVFDHVEAIQNHCKKNIIDYIFVNNRKVPRDLELKYFYLQRSAPIYLDDVSLSKLEQLGIQVVSGEYLHVENELIRHDADAICTDILKHCME